MAFEAPSPLNYILQIPNPAEQLQKSLAAGMQIAQGQQATQAAVDAHALAQQEIQAKNVATQQAEVERQNVLAFRKRFAENAANPTAGGNLAMIRDFPQYTAQLTSASKAISAEQAKQLQSIHAADLSGAHDVADQEIQKLATSYLNSKDPQDQAYGKTLMDGRKLHAENPGAYANMMGVKIAEGIGGEEYGKIYGGVTKLPAEILKGNSDASAARLVSLNKERELEDAHKTAVAAANASNATTDEKNYALETSKKLFQFKYDQTKAESEKAVAEAKKAARDASGFSELGGKQYEEARQGVESAGPSITKAMSLANQIRTKGMASGVLADVNDIWHRFTGTPNETQRLNQEFSTIANSSILGDMKGLGRITGPELELFSHGVPTENQSGEDKARFLETYAKVRAYMRDQDLLKTKYIQANGDLTPAKKNITIDGRKFPMGAQPPGLDVTQAPSPAAPAGTATPSSLTPQQVTARRAEIARLLAANQPAVK